MLHKLKNILFCSLRRQLIVGMALIVGTMMTLFIWDATSQQKKENVAQQTQQAFALAQGVAVSAAVWVESRDFSGMQEIIDGISHYPDLRYAILLDRRGEVLAHSDPGRRGQYLNDLPRNDATTIIQETPGLVDVGSPVMLAGRQIGWVRIGLSRDALDSQLAEMTQDGVLYSLAAITVCVIFAALTGSYLTRRLYAIQQVADAVQTGKSKLRASVSGDDEAAQLARRFNRMLDSLEQREEALSRSEMKYRTLYDSTSDAVMLLDDHGFFDCNNAALAMFGCNTRDEFCSKHPADFSPPMQPCGTDSRRLATRMIMVAMEEGSHHFEWMHCRADNARVFPADVLFNRLVLNNQAVLQATVRDITKAKESEEEIRHLAFYDALTGLPNRRLMLDRLQHSLASSARNEMLSALLFIDLDDFKNLNDTLGHDIGDLLLQQVAQRLLGCVRESDTVARLGGDEFLVMLEDLNQDPLEAAAQTRVVGEKIMSALNQPYRIFTFERRSTPSIGATLFGRKQGSIEEIMKQADIAMYQAKKSGRNSMCFFDPRMQESVTARAALEEALHDALVNQEFRLFYQIQVDKSLRPVGAEALLRWIDPGGRMVSPSQFIPLAEENGEILPIGAWVLDTACAQLRAWQQNPLTSSLVLAVNVSAKQFRQTGFVSQVRSTVERHGIDPGLLKIELTESMFLENIESAIEIMTELKQFGIKFSLDDFGTGYSSLQYLKRLPLDQIKIDQSFVRDIGFNSSDKAIVRTIIAMASSLDLDVIAEGVETEAQRQLLLRQGCRHYQGYLFGRPVPIEKFEAKLKSVHELMAS